MNAPFNPKLHDAPDSIDFELVPVDTARAALDELPAGVESLPTLMPGYWAQRRRKPGPSDRALTGPAIDWLLSLPEPARPKLLCERYVRVVNAIATAGPGAERLAVLDGLLVDRRGHRAGFPPEVRHEIELLREWVAAAGPSGGR